MPKGIRYSKELKQQVLAMVREGKSTLDEVAQHFGLRKKTVYDMTRFYRASHNIRYNHNADTELRTLVNDFHRKIGELVCRDILSGKRF